MSDGNWAAGMLKMICVDGNKWADELAKDKRIQDCKIEAIKHEFWAIDFLVQEIEKMIDPKNKKFYTDSM